MKKINLLLTALLLLISSIVFCACGDVYKDLKIECDAEVVELVMGDSVELARATLDFEISGVKSWGEINVDSSPQGLVRTSYKIQDKHCYVGIEALQPTDEGAVLTIQHLGSGKSLSIPLKIGMKLNSITATGNEYIVEIPTGEDEKLVDIKVNDVLYCEPINYTDKLIWLPSNNVEGVEVVNYLKNGETTENIFTTSETDMQDKYNGTSQVVKNYIKVNSSCKNGATLILHPVTVVDEKAILHKDIEVVVKFVNLLKLEDIVLTSPTHNTIEGDGEAENLLLGDLVLINNPTSIRYVNKYVESATGGYIETNEKLSTDYNYYSTAIINLKYNDVDRGLVSLNDELVKDIYDIYKLDISADIDNLLIDVVDNGMFRVTATNSCIGKGNIVVTISPNKSSGEIKPIVITIPCEVGEQATGFKGSRINEDIQFTYNADFDMYLGSAVLTDDYSTSNGQRFNFEVLGANTLSALKSYRIVIDKNLLYINDIYTQDNINKYIRNNDGSDYDLSSINSYKYQISLKKDGKEIYFYDVDGTKFVSEPLNAKNAIYIKYYIDETKNENESFYIDIKNLYDGRYDIEDSKFESTTISYRLNFIRRRKVEIVDYSPADMVKAGASISIKSDATNWQFYFTTDVLMDDNYYGIYINKVWGINNSVLTPTELSEIGLTMKVEKVDGGNCNIGVGSLDNENKVEFLSSYTYNYLGESNKSNFIAIGKLNAEDIELGDYRFVISQYGVEIVSKNIKIYKELEEDNINISIPNADFINKGNIYSNVIDDAYIISTLANENKNYKVDIDVEDKEFVNFYVLNNNITIIPHTDGKDVLSDTYLNNNFIYNSASNSIITGDTGLYNAETGENNYIKIVYTFTVDQYDYYQKKVTTKDIIKEICIFIYEPMTSARFNKTDLYKYNYNDCVTKNYDTIVYENEFCNEYCKENLSIVLNNESVFNYVDISWKINAVDGIWGVPIISGDNRNATFTFTSGGMDSLTSIISATVSQFGVEVPIYCRFVVSRPVLTESIELNNEVSSFKNGDSFLSLKDNQTLQISAENYSSKGVVSLLGLKYLITNANGYKDDTVATISNSGEITTHKAGKVKLIIVATDSLKQDISNVVNYLKFATYVKNNAYLVLDLIVSDGTEQNPYLISNVNDLKSINTDLSKHYALINDINLNGEPINLGVFTGGLVSYQESNDSNNRFGIYGLTLHKNNQKMCLFEQVGQQAYIKNVDFYVMFDCIIDSNNDTLIGLVAENYGLIENVTINVLGTINGSSLQSNIYVGAITAKNYGTIKIDAPTLVGVQGSITIDGCVNANVIAGGVIGENSGEVIGALTDVNLDESLEDISYEVYYDTQGAMADITIRVKACKNVNNASAIGGIVGKNLGIVSDVYSTGKILGYDDKQEVLVDNIGGLIGYNINPTVNNTLKFSIKAVNNIELKGSFNVLQNVNFEAQQDFQVINSYSTMQIVGRNNVGGAIGLDNKGVYKKVYYEIYDDGITLIKGVNNVGGLVGYSIDGTFLYCYVNSFVWGYNNNPEIYELEGNTNVGGLIGYVDSSGDATSSSTKGLHIANSLASITISGVIDVAGLVGRMDGFGGIYTAYFYGSASNINTKNIVNMYIGNSINNSNTPYRNVYSIINGTIKFNDVFSGTYPDIALINEGTAFNIKTEYNNGYPYIKYGSNDVNLVSVVPTIVTIKDAFYVNSTTNYLSGVIYVLENSTYMRYELKDGKYIRYDEDGTIIELDTSQTKYTAQVYSSMFELNSQGDYVIDNNGNYVLYNEDTYAGGGRYVLRADIARTQDASSTDSDYREDILVLYYYQFTSLTGSSASTDMKTLNTFDMHKLLNDNGINVYPNTNKRFKLSSSNNDVVSILANGKLLLRQEGTAIITLTSVLNKNATASFVVVVRNKVLNFGLYSSANVLEEYNIKDNNLNIVKNTSNIIYSNYSSIVEIYDREYECERTTNIEIDFEISVEIGSLEDGKNIFDYISLNGNMKDGVYTIDDKVPITISIKNYFDGKFKITAKPYIVVNYVNDLYTEKLRVALSDYFATQFYVTTKKGVTAVNTDATYIEMMPSDNAKVQVEIGSDIAIDTIKVDLYAQNENGEASYNNGEENINYSDMIDFYYVSNGRDIKIEYNPDKNGMFINISDLGFADVDEILFKNFVIKLVPNEKSYGLTHLFKIQITLTVIDGDENNLNDVSTILNLVVKPQQISSLITLTYRSNNGMTSLDEGELTNIIRPGTRNIIVIDVAPNIAVYDYIEIDDLTSEDTISFMQLDSELNSVSSGEISSTGKGIKLKKLSDTSSTLYVAAILPLLANANITHLIKITAYDADGMVLKTNYTSLEAILYPTIIMTYVPPKGAEITADTRRNNEQTTDLAMGVEANIKIDTFNIDTQSLNYSVNVKENESCNTYITFGFESNNYVLRFNYKYKDNWNELLGKTIVVTFTAEKTLNGITEKVSATINFVVRRLVIHSVSISNSNLEGNTIVGDYDKEIEMEFYFGKLDISYYDMNTDRYWDKQYTMANTSVDLSNADLVAINNILKGLNSPTTTNGVDVYFVGNNEDFKILQGESKTIGDLEDNTFISISNTNNKYYITANSKSNINNFVFKVTFNLVYNINDRPVLTNADENIVQINKGVGFNLTPKSSVLEERLKVETVEDLLNMQEGKFYELTTDLTLEEYLPLSTNIGGLDGKGYTITIKSFDIAGMAGIYSDGVAYVGLFGTLNENCIIENLQINYDKITIDFTGEVLTSGANYSNLYFGGVAGLNLGVITNVRTFGSVTLTANQIIAENIFIGGISGFNGTSNATKLATITNSTTELEMIGLALIGGITSTNNGKISNTIFAGTISYLQTSSEYSATIYTAGLAVYNYGNIALCGVKGESITSVGDVGGFVANNQGSISNSFVNNVTITAQGDIGGFVYQNSGEITLSYAYSVLLTSRFYETFIRNTESYGTITDCYVVGSIGKQGKIAGLKVLSGSELVNSESYNNFVFASTDYGLWSIGETGPELKNAGFNKDFSGYNIYDVITFEGYLEMCARGVVGEQVIINQQFRIVRDIDLSTLLDNPITCEMTLASSIEGNNMAVSGYSIYNNGNVEKIGLFGTIKQNNENNVYVRNLIVNPSNIRASGSAVVGGLAGEIDSVYMYNIEIDNNNLMILGKNVVGGIAGIIVGDFEIIGIKSNVSAFSTYTYGTQYNLYTGKNVTNNVYADNISTVSYAGAIAGIINGYRFGSFNAYKRSDANCVKVSNVIVLQDVVLVADIVGGAFGLVGERTMVDNMNYELNSNTKYQGVYIAGGLVGENRGIISRAKIYTSLTDETDTSVCFDKLTTSSEGIVGGIVGINIGGLIYNSSSYVNVYSSLNLSNVGGIVGRNIIGIVADCSVFGDINGYFVGGICGADYSYNNMVNSTTSNDVIKVCNNISKTIEYTINGKEIKNRYSNNLISFEFINNFVSHYSNYYKLNISIEENKLISAEKVFGLLVGFSNEDFKFGENAISLEDNGMLINVSDNSFEDAQKTCEVTCNETTYSINCITNLVSENIDIVEGCNFTLLYLIGFYDSEKYQNWNSLLENAYSNKYIICSNIDLSITE